MKKNNTKFLIAFIFYLLPLSMFAETPGTAAIPTIPYDLRSDSIDILHTTARIDIRNFASHTINAHSTLACKAKTNGLHQVKIDLTGLTIDSVQTNHIATAFMISGQGLLLALPLTFNTNDSFDLDFFYHGTPIQNAGDWGGFYWDANYAYNIGVSFLEDQHSYGRTWLPCLDNFVEKCTYEYFITTDTFRKAFCGGNLIGITHQDSTTTWHWRDSDPVSAYLASITLSDYATIASTYNGIERTIPIQLGARPADTSNLKASFIHLPDALAAFENSYGPYQFDRVGYCLTPFSAGAMEHDCNITFMKALVDGTTNYETTMAHELSHHWFGDLVTCENAGDMWLNEGWASYSEKIFTENLYGKLAYNKAVRLNHDQVLHLAHISDSMYYAVAGIPSQYTYGRTVYDKGADVAHTLRGYMGDTMFFRVLKDYMNDMKFKNINSAQFRDYIKTHCSFNPDAFFDNWVFAPGFPHFAIDNSTTTGTAGNYTTALTIRQKLNHAPAYYTHVPLEIAAFDANFNKQIFTTNIDGLCTQTSISTAFQPVFIALDFNEKISDAITDEYKTIKLNATYDFGTAKLILDVKRVTDSVLVRVEHNWVAPDPMKYKVDGIILSDYRYWTIDGIFDSTFKANATVLYNGTNNTSTGYYDNSFITNREDSLLIVYRKNASEDWRACDSCRINVQGNVNDKVGKMVIYNVQKGQYALAIHDSRKIDTTVYQKNCDELSIQPIKKNESFNIYPNPTNDYFTIESKNINAFVQCAIYDQAGQLVFTKNYTNQNKFIVAANTWTSGTYLILLRDKSGALLGHSKMVIY